MEEQRHRRIDELDRRFEFHRADPWAHQPARAESREAFQGVYGRLDRLEAWKNRMVGALTVLTLLWTGVGAAIAVSWLSGHRGP